MPERAPGTSHFLLLCTLLLACSGLCAAQARADGRLQVDVVERESGRVLPTWQHAGRLYVAGEPGTRYEIRVRNTTPRRLLAVVSVDGVNVLSGETAAHDQRGYVVDPWTTTAIDGWRKSLREAAAFYFTALPDSYAARTGRPDHVGVIGVAVFEEWQRPQPRVDYYYPLERERGAEAKSRADAAADSLGAIRQEAPAAAPRLGTGHGERLESLVTTTDFRRASTTPVEVIAIEYDRQSNLVARGIVPPVIAEPQPFPQSFVPDPGA